MGFRSTNSGSRGCTRISLPGVLLARVFVQAFYLGFEIRGLEQG